MQHQTLLSKAIERDLEHFFMEDDLARNYNYLLKLPNDQVKGTVYFKSDMVIAGLPFFLQAFAFLGQVFTEDDHARLTQWEGRKVAAGDKFSLPLELNFSHALMGERIALNLLQQASSIATYTSQFVDIAKKYCIAILDTRKTTPGLRSLEKYAVTTGGGVNHRLGQADMWMVKDNHKQFFGGIAPAVNFFRSLHGFYTPIEVEIHDLQELQEATNLGINHLMLDNFTPQMVTQAIAYKKAGMTFEVSGGIRLETIESFCIPGVDAISIGAITYDAPHVDISFKYHR